MQDKQFVETGNAGIVLHGWQGCGSWEGLCWTAVAKEYEQFGGHLSKLS